VYLSKESDHLCIRENVNFSKVILFVDIKYRLM